jgi:chromosome segregation ATPase
MFKKFFLFGSALALVAVAVCGIPNLRHGVSWIENQVKDNVPVEYELDRARRLIKDTEPQIRECKRVIAQNEVQIEFLTAEVDRLFGSQSRLKDNLKLQHAALQENRSMYLLTSGSRVTRAQFERRVARTLGAAQAKDALISSKTAQLSALKSGLESARETLATLRAQKENLVAMAEALEAKLRENEAKKAQTLHPDVDTSNFAKAREILEECQMRLAVEARIMENDEPLIDELPAEDGSATIQASLGAYLGLGEEPTVPMHEEEGVARSGR